MRTLLVVATPVTALMLLSCGSEPSEDTQTVACQLDAFNQCLEWIELSGSLVDSLSDTCVEDDGGQVVDACPSANRIGTCEDKGGFEPDSLNHFYLPEGEDDPEGYAALKEAACVDSGGVWVPA